MRRAWWICLLSLLGCSHSSARFPPAVQAVIEVGEQSRWMTTGDDPWDVVICHVPSDTQSLVYAGLPLRTTLTPERIATLLDEQVTAYFHELSNGAYRPRFSAGGEVTIGATDEPQACVNMALAVAGDHARGVIAVADAEHNANQEGGFANPGSECGAPPCAASGTRRSAYVGAADFGPDWGGRPPMDLIEHELGHALGWPHSGYDESFNEPTRSALDVMSNSAAPRAIHPDRRDGPGTLAVNLLEVGWLPTTAVVVVPGSGAPGSGVAVTLAPSAGSSGTRMAVVELDNHAFITVELLAADGFDDHLPTPGVAVHLIEGSDSTRKQTPLVGVAPYDDLLSPGETFTGNGWSIAVADGWQATIQPIEDVPTVSG